MFWALLFLSIGALLLLQTIFKIDLPILKILFGVFLIYMGVKVIAGSFGLKMHRFKIEKVSTESEAVFSDSEFRAKKTDGSVNRKYSTVFGGSVLDLRGLSADELKEKIEIDSAFGKVKVITDSHMPLKVEINSAFASVAIRGQKFGAFGDIQFQSPDFKSDQAYLNLGIDVAFGEVTID